MASYTYGGTVSVAIWAKRSAGWQKVSDDYVFVDGGSYASGGSRTFPWSISNRVYQLGSGVLAVGVTVEFTSGVSATLTDFTKLAWQAQGTAASVRSATPNGQKTTVTISP